MPVLTFLHDVLAYAKGPYFRCVGRYTHTFCQRADRYAKTPIQRRIWLSTAISADEIIATLAGLEKRRSMGAMAGWQVDSKDENGE